jgi:translocation and assembly module TamB
MLIAEPYRPFFGAETALTANGLLREGGGVSVSGLRLSGGQLSLDASAETTPDNFLRALKLDAVIADAAGGKVTLPVPGGATRLGNGQLHIDFGNDGTENWNAALAVSGFEMPGFAAQALQFDMGGVAVNLSDPATRRLTFNGDGALSGISASEAVEAALGDSIGLGVAGLSNWRNCALPGACCRRRCRDRSTASTLPAISTSKRPASRHSRRWPGAISTGNWRSGPAEKSCRSAAASI